MTIKVFGDRKNIGLFFHPYPPPLFPLKMRVNIFSYKTISLIGFRVREKEGLLKDEEGYCLNEFLYSNCASNSFK